MTEFTSVGRSATDRASRYGSQLVKHFTAKDLEGSWEDTRGFVRFSAGLAEFEAADDGLIMRVVCTSEEDVARLRDVVERHLVRFGTRDELSVTWDSGSEN
ncbi:MULTISPECIES: DUF2218 domain-containing protein [Lentzea]|jgi:hypothetical protein|uniref:DUF2218 domain-containing protein n=2 Tax=Lentzea TaxID=165301 RepID=A0A1H9US88_9PSEU|nr:MULTISPECIES: DUF2218 domain-containing protein [Lentzea]MCR3748608.1 hypothetical protein [Lentzea californiensis]RDI27760.1 hypothetical protein DFR72_106247 [Lentzea flaviverrucosa]SDL80584.1 hypothetical protein SAMN04488074_113205 [Lentzea albidocapillata subsp. violacea]SES12256.1 hypothetical protein SAMN05216195_10998 [Lentzea flaviverrucosa]